MGGSAEKTCIFITKLHPRSLNTVFAHHVGVSSAMEKLPIYIYHTTLFPLFSKVAKSQ